MRTIGLDLGTKTIGIAISDIFGLIATPVGVVRYKENDLNAALTELKEEIIRLKPEKIVLGLPKNMDGSCGPQAQYSLKFKEMLEEEFKQEVIMIDERMTTHIAEAVMIDADVSRKKRKSRIDKLAATIILQTYLDKKGGCNGRR